MNGEGEVNIEEFLKRLKTIDSELENTTIDEGALSTTAAEE